MPPVAKNADYIRAIARTGSISAAASEFGVAQPTVSAALKKAERQLGTRIIDRSSTPLALTEAGRAYLDCEDKVAEIKRALARTVSDIEELRCGEVAVGAVGTFNVAYLPRAIARFAQRYPGIDVFVHDGTAPEMTKALLGGKIDLLVAPALADNDALACEELLSERIFLCVPPDWPEMKMLPEPGAGGFAPIGKDDFAILADCSFITMLDDQAVGQIMNDLLSANGIAPKRVIQANQMLTCLALTVQGVGISLVTESALACLNLEKRPALYLPDDPACSRTLCLASAKNRRASRAAGEFSRILKEAVARVKPE